MNKANDNLTNYHIDILKEIGNIGSGNAITALSKLLNKKIDMDVPQVKVLGFNEISEILGSAEMLVVGILLSVSGDINGSILFVLKYEDAEKLVQFLINEYLGMETDEFTELQMSALKEIGNILAGSYVGALSTLTNLNLFQGIPEIAIDMAGAILSVPAIEFGKEGDNVLYIETKFKEGHTNITGDFFLIPDSGSYDTLLKALGV